MSDEPIKLDSAAAAFLPATETSIIKQEIEYDKEGRITHVSVIISQPCKQFAEGGKLTVQYGLPGPPRCARKDCNVALPSNATEIYCPEHGLGYR